MLKTLQIQNIILIEYAQIPFNEGLNVLSGETGSGKSAIMDGLGLVLGDRAEGTILRKGCEKGSVLATFDIGKHSDVHKILDEAGIDHEEGQELVLKREISASGKSRAFINHQSVQLPLLKKLGETLFQIVGQHSNQRLFSIDFHRSVLDVYGNQLPLADKFKANFEQETKLKTELQNLISGESQRVREIDGIVKELEELQEASIKNGEDEELFAEYSRLSNAEELSSKLQEINTALTHLTHLNRQKSTFEKVIQLDPSLEETAECFKAAILELQEVSHTLSQYANKLSHDPQHLASINERLTLINRCKRKYGQTVEEIKAYEVEAKERLKTLENADVRIEELKNEIKETELKSDDLAKQLSEKRRNAAIKFEKELTEQLRSLNMPQAECSVSITLQKRNSFGDDKVEFFLLPNVGEHKVALREGASGGEMSRFLLALQTLLAGKEQIPILVFDEIDANIGGETALTVGQKLKAIGQKHQVICITHFPQVAEHATHHLQISKQEKDGRTVTIVQSLDKNSKTSELKRMVGQKTSTLAKK